MFFKKKKKAEKFILNEDVPTMNTIGNGIGSIPDYINHELMPVGETISSFKDEEKLLNNNYISTFNVINEPPVKLEVEKKDLKNHISENDNNEKKSLKDMSADEVFIDIVKNDSFCHNCGAKLNNNTKKCFICETEISIDK